MDYQITFSDTTKAPVIVKPYTTNGPQNPNAVTPLYGSATSASTSLVLLGKGMFDYGEPIQKNLIHLMEHFANRTRPAYPVQGQVWYKTESVGDPLWPNDPSAAGLYVYTGSAWSQIPSAGSPLTTQLDVGEYKIINVADAVDPTDALNLRTGDARYVNVTGDSMVGNLSMSSNRVTNVGNAVDATDAVSVAFGDSRYLRISGGQMMGTLDVNNNMITNLRDAINPQDALNLRTAKALFVTNSASTIVDGGTY